MLKQLGSLCIILGTCIAAGLLGLPIITANNHYIISMMMVFSAWCLMTLGAWCLMKVTLWSPKNSNLISMSEATLGKPGKYVTWIVYVFLLYSLICAYLAATGDVVQSLFNALHVPMTRTWATVLSTLCIGGIIYRGIRSVDLCNRIFMSVKLIICLTLITLIAPHAHIKPLITEGDFTWRFSAWLVIICAFGYAIIIPSIRDYLDNNEKKLQRIVLIGSFIPLVLYLVWIAVIQATLSRYGEHGLISMNNSSNTNSLLMQELIAISHHALLNSASVVFISICSITGLLGVSLCMTDFLADGLKKKKEGLKKLLLVCLTLLPSTIIVIVKPSLFIQALAYAGICCLYILILLPIAMYIRGKIVKMESRGLRHG